MPQTSNSEFAPDGLHPWLLETQGHRVRGLPIHCECNCNTPATAKRFRQKYIDLIQAHVDTLWPSVGDWQSSRPDLACDRPAVASNARAVQFEHYLIGIQSEIDRQRCAGAR